MLLQLTNNTPQSHFVLTTHVARRSSVSSESGIPRLVPDPLPPPSPLSFPSLCHRFIPPSSRSVAGEPAGWKSANRRSHVQWRIATTTMTRRIEREREKMMLLSSSSSHLAALTISSPSHTKTIFFILTLLSTRFTTKKR